MDLTGKTVIEPGYDYKYVYVELIRKEKYAYDVVSGLFRGIYYHNEDIYIIIGNADILNVKYYGIMTIEALVSKNLAESNSLLQDDKKHLMVFTHEDKDQEKALSLLSSIYTHLIANDMGTKNDGAIIDLDKYIDVPDTYFNDKDITISHNNSVKTNVNSSKYKQPANRYIRGTNNFVKSDIKSDPVPKLIKREATQVKPSEDDIKDLIIKLAAIRNGTYEPNLPDITQIDDEESNDDDENLNYYPYYTGGQYA